MVWWPELPLNGTAVDGDWSGERRTAQIAIPTHDGITMMLSTPVTSRASAVQS